MTTNYQVIIRVHYHENICTPSHNCEHVRVRAFVYKSLYIYIFLFAINQFLKIKEKLQSTNFIFLNDSLCFSFFVFVGKPRKFVSFTKN